MQAQEQALQTTSASLLEEFEKNNPTVESSQDSQTTSDGIGSGSPVSSHVSPSPTVSSNNITLWPPTVTHQLPSLDTESVNAITTKSASSQLSDVSPSTGVSLQIANNSSVPQNNLSQSSIIPNAMNVLLDMNDTDISQEGMVYESGVDSDVSPNNSLSFSQLTPPYTTPPNFALNRSFSLPPGRNFHSQMWHGAGRYRHYSFSDYVSEM